MCFLGSPSGFCFFVCLLFLVCLVCIVCLFCISGISSGSGFLVIFVSSDLDSSVCKVLFGR